MEPQSTTIATHTDSGKPQGRPDVLIVEDDAQLANILRVKLVSSGLSAVIARDGVEAMEAIKKQSPRLILLDLLLPKKDGFEVLRALGEENLLGVVPVLIVSNFYSEDKIEQGKALGAVDYFAKAKVSTAELVDNVKKYLAEK